MALNNVWLGQCRIWAREARFDRFAFDSNHGYSEERLLGDEGTVVPVVRVKGVGIKNVRVGKQVEGERGEGAVAEKVGAKLLSRPSEVVRVVAPITSGACKPQLLVKPKFVSVYRSNIEDRNWAIQVW